MNIIKKVNEVREYVAGCDVVASSKEALKNIYRDYYEWILKYDRARIDETLTNCNI